MPKASVIIPTYNMAGHVCQAIESVLSQTYKDFEIIIVNDGSTDNTQKVLKRYHKNKKIRIINQNNRGPCCARNAGISQSRGKYVSWLDADDIWRKDMLEKQIGFLEKHKQIYIVHSNVYRFDNNIGDAKVRTLLFDVNNASETTLMKHILSGDYHVNNTQVSRKKCIKDAGLFDVNLSKLGCEDFDLWFRLLRKYKNAYINEPLAYYRRNPAGFSKNLPRIEQGRRYVLDKLFSDPTLPKQIANMKKAAYANMYLDFCVTNFHQRKYLQSCKNALRALIRDPFIFERKIRRFIAFGSYQ